MSFQGAEVITSASVSNLQAHVKITPIFKSSKKKINLCEDYYRKFVYKSRSLCAIFQLFGAASIQVRLLFESGLCTHVQRLESAKLVNAVWHM